MASLMEQAHLQVSDLEHPVVADYLEPGWPDFHPREGDKAEREDEDDQETLASQRSKVQRTAQGQLRDFSISMPRLSAQDVDMRLLPQQVKTALDFLTVLNPLEAVPDTTAEKMATLLPAQRQEHQGRRTLVLDLDETLVHCHCQPTELVGSNPRPDLYLELNNGDRVFPIVMRANVYVRPYARRLLRQAAEEFEVVVFTASASIYADKVLDYLDPGRKLVAHRLYRESCTEIAGGHFKDVRRLGRPLKDIVLVDNSPLAPGLAPDNGLIVASWYGDNQKDDELMQLLKLLPTLLSPTVESLPEYLAQRYGFKAYLEELRASQPRNRLGGPGGSMLRMQMMCSTSSVIAQVRR